MQRWLALDLAETIRHDGDGGVADDLADASGLTEWVRARSELLEPGIAADAFTADEPARLEVVHVRTAIRALFARTVHPAPPSRADAHRLPPAEEALADLNRAAAQVPVSIALSWHADAPPTIQMTAAASAENLDLLVSALARDAIEFLTAPDSRRLTACTAPRCVRYFLKDHGRQEYCKPSCSNRARAARHYQRHHADPDAQIVVDEFGHLAAD
jgi:predicted RNA-binding Zn ribbon-like protein